LVLLIFDESSPQLELQFARFCWANHVSSVRQGMRLIARGSSVRCWVAALLTMLPISIVWPSTILAGCAAHYGYSGSPWNGKLAHLELLSLTGAIPAPAQELPGETPKPCSGALCSGNPAPLPSTIPTVPPPTGPQWAMPVLEQILVGSGSFQPRQTDTMVCPLDHACSIFHPPRIPFDSSTLS
jgi:hypothetical protein